MKLGIDYGHGGKSIGCSFNVCTTPILEKNLTRRIGEELVHSLPYGMIVPVILRHDDDTVSFESRGRIAHSTACDWVLSIHVNSNRNAAFHGMEIYIPPDRVECAAVSRAILAAAPQTLRPTRIIEAVNKPNDPTDDWLERPKHVLDPYPTIPRILVECGYLSHDGDRSILTSSEGRMAIVSAMRVGVAHMAQLHRSR